MTERAGVTDPDLARLREIAENPLARPSERVAARLALKPFRGPERFAGWEREAALSVARRLLAEMVDGDERVILENSRYRRISGMT